MLKNFSKITLALLLILGGSWLDAASLTNPFTTTAFQHTADGGNLTVTQIADSGAYMSWTMSGSAPYQVIVRDLTTSTVLTSFTTSNTNATIGGLTVGHTYRFETSNATETFITELIVAG